jgi:hypothetical protein
MRQSACAIALLVALAASAAPAVHPLTAAIDLNANLRLVARWQPTDRQLMDLLSAARGAQQAVATRERSDQQAVETRADLFRQQAQCLAQGMPVDQAVTDGVAAYFGELEDARLKMMAAVDVQVRAVRRALAPDQARLVAWARPAEIGADGDEPAAATELRQMLADVTEAIRMLERIRYLIASDFATTRTGRIAEYLRQYFRPKTPEFNDAMEWMLDLTDEVRKIKEADWPAQAPLFAGRVLRYVGALDAPDAPQEQAPYNWWDVYYLLTDPHTPEMLQAMLAARGAPAGQ